jgi:hypothetical protein
VEGLKISPHSASHLSSVNLQATNPPCQAVNVSGIISLWPAAAKTPHGQEPAPSSVWHAFGTQCTLVLDIHMGWLGVVLSFRRLRMRLLLLIIIEHLLRIKLGMGKMRSLVLAFEIFEDQELYRKNILGNIWAWKGD